jgi:hypothetical protein
MRCSPLLLKDILDGTSSQTEKWENDANLASCIAVMLDSLPQPN